MSGDPSGRADTPRRWQQIGLAMLALLALAALIWLLVGGEAWLDSYGLSSLAQVQATLRRWGPWASVASIALVGVHAFIPYPVEIMAIANGAVFGFAWGLFLTWTGSMLGAVLSYLLARLAGGFVPNRLLSERQHARLGHWHARHGTRTLLAVRLVPLISFSAVNYLAGLAGVAFWRFLWTTAVGILPVGILVVGAGAGLVAQGGIPAWIGATSALALLPFVPMLWRYARRRGRQTR